MGRFNRAILEIRSVGTRISVNTLDYFSELNSL